MNNLAPTKNCPMGVQGNLNGMPWYTQTVYKTNGFPISQQTLIVKNVVLLDFSLSVKAAPHECVIRTGQP